MTNDLSEPPESPEVVVKHSGWRTLLGKAARLLGYRAPVHNESDEDRRGLIRSALVERFGADDRFLWVDSVFSDEGQVVFEVEGRNGGDSGLFRVAFEVAEGGAVTLGEPEEVRRVTTFEPVTNAGDDNNQEDGVMNREQMIAQLAEAGPLGKDALSKLSDCQLRALSGSGQQPADNGQGDGWEKAREWRQKFEDLDSQTRNARQSEEKERAELLDNLLFNAKTIPWTESEIKGMDIVELRKVHRLAFPKKADFSGRGGPAQTQANLSWLKPMDEAIGAREAN